MPSVGSRPSRHQHLIERLRGTQRTPGRARRTAPRLHALTGHRATAGLVLALLLCRGYLSRVRSGP